MNESAAVTLLCSLMQAHPCNNPVPISPNDSTMTANEKPHTQSFVKLTITKAKPLHTEPITQHQKDSSCPLLSSICHHLERNLQRLQPSRGDGSIHVYFTSVLGHVQLIPQTVCYRHPESAALSGFRFERCVTETKLKRIHLWFTMLEIKPLVF